MEPESTKRVRASIAAQHKARLEERLAHMAERIALHVKAGLALQRDYLQLKQEIAACDTTLRAPILRGDHDLQK
jgi:hypothetical protein